MRLASLVLALLPLAVSAQTFTRADDLPRPLDLPISPTVVDMDGDGRADLVFGTSVLRQTDTGWEMTTLDGPRALGTLVADWNRDGVREAALLGLFQPRAAQWNRARGILQDLPGTGLGTGPDFPLIQGSILLDDDRDGWVDLLIGNDGPPDVLYHQGADGVFSDVSATVLPGTDGGTYGMAAADYDRDGDLDVAIGLCLPIPAENLLYRRGATAFEEVGASVGADDPRASWGLAWLDYDGDGWLDLAVANMPQSSGGPPSPGTNGLYRNMGDGTFLDIGGDAGIAGPADEDSWSVVAADFDNDGWTDLVFANRRGGGPVAEPWRFFRNVGGVFVDATPGSGLEAFEAIAIAAGDVNGDGWVDLVSLAAAQPVVFSNDGGTNHWLTVDLRGLASNPDGIGARVEVAAGGETRVREITAGDGFMAQSHGLEAHVGLGAETSATVTVRWPSGTVDVVSDVAADQRITIVEGEGRNDAPGPFALLGPADGAEIQGLVVELSWEPAPDDGDVTYTVYLEPEPGTSTTFTTTETVLSVTANDLGNTNHWAVVASDGRSERTSLEARSFDFSISDVTEEGPRMEPRLIVGPNPVADRLLVRATGLPPGLSTLTVLDARGREVLSRAVSGTDTTLDLGDLPPGLYTVRLDHPSGTVTAPVVVSR